jgi:hypothetical protein
VLGASGGHVHEYEFAVVQTGSLEDDPDEDAGPADTALPEDDSDEEVPPAHTWPSIGEIQPAPADTVPPEGALASIPTGPWTQLHSSQNATHSVYVFFPHLADRCFFYGSGTLTNRPRDLRVRFHDGETNTYPFGKQMHSQDYQFEGVRRAQLRYPPGARVAVQDPNDNTRFHPGTIIEESNGWHRIAYDSLANCRSTGWEYLADRHFPLYNCPVRDPRSGSGSGSRLEEAEIRAEGIRLQAVAQRLVNQALAAGRACAANAEALRACRVTGEADAAAAILQNRHLEADLRLELAQLSSSSDEETNDANDEDEDDAADEDEDEPQEEDGCKMRSLSSFK